MSTSYIRLSQKYPNPGELFNDNMDKTANTDTDHKYVLKQNFTAM